MAKEIVSMLFAPPRAPLRLDTRLPTILGRSSACDLVIARPGVSRRHAEIRPEDGGFVLGELGSTNGTFVNGRAIAGKHWLSPGDRIEIGGVEVSFCVVPLAKRKLPPEAGTTMFLTPTPLSSADVLAWMPDGLRGDLAEVPPLALFQMLHCSGRSGALRFKRGTVHGMLFVEAGQPIHATAGPLVGIRAAVELLKLAGGRFRYLAEAVPPERTIRESFTHVLLEASRARDEESVASDIATLHLLRPTPETEEMERLVPDEPERSASPA